MKTGYAIDVEVDEVMSRDVTARPALDEIAVKLRQAFLDCGIDAFVEVHFVTEDIAYAGADEEDDDGS
jgi:hypothetical protein